MYLPISYLSTVHPGKNAPIGKIVTHVYSIYYIYIYGINSIYKGPQYILQGEYTFKVYLRERNYT